MRERDMYRSSSWNRGSDQEYNVGLISPPLSGLMRMASVDGDQQLPMYDENAEEMAKKERSQAKFAENAVHLIPLVLILCALVLWLFSTTPGTVTLESGTRVEGLSIEGETDNVGDAKRVEVNPIVNFSSPGRARYRRSFEK